jgi:hypothetical protein
MPQRCRTLRRRCCGTQAGRGQGTVIAVPGQDGEVRRVGGGGGAVGPVQGEVGEGGRRRAGRRGAPVGAGGLGGVGVVKAGQFTGGGEGKVGLPRTGGTARAGRFPRARSW